MKKCMIIGKANTGKTLFLINFAEYLGLSKITLNIMRREGPALRKTYTIKDAKEYLSDHLSLIHIFHLTNGFQLKGIVKGFDNFTVILDNEGKQMLIYKHAISTITPSKLVTFNSSNSDKADK